MSRNGLFADDGMVTDPANAIAQAIKGVRTLVTSTKDGMDTQISAITQTLAAINAKNNSQDEALNAITTGLAGVGQNATNLAAAFAAIKERFDDLEVENTPCWARAVQTNGFTVLTTSGNAVPLTSHTLAGGTEFYPDFGGGIKVPYSGAYMVMWNACISGGATDYARLTPQVYRNGSLAMTLPSLISAKPNGQDITGSRSAIVYLNDLDCVTLRGSSTSPNVSSWGDSGRIGTDLFVQWLGWR